MSQAIVCRVRTVTTGEQALGLDRGAGRASAGLITISLADWSDDAIDTRVDGGAKIFTYQGSSNLSGDELDSVVFNEALGIYSISVSGDLPNAFTLDYTVAITNASHVFNRLDAAGTVPLTEIDIDKWFYNSGSDLVATLHVDDGEPVTTPFGNYGNWLWTHVEVTSPDGLGAISSLSDTYHQSGVPEPGTFVLAGLRCVCSVSGTAS